MMTVRLVHWEGTSVTLLQLVTLWRENMGFLSMSLQVSYRWAFLVKVWGQMFLSLRLGRAQTKCSAALLGVSNLVP